MKTKQKEQQKKEPAKMKATWVKKGMLEKFVSNNKQTLGKEKARKIKIEETQINNVFEKGVDGQKAKKKWNFEREDKKEKPPQKKE